MSTSLVADYHLIRYPTLLNRHSYNRIDFCYYTKLILQTFKSYEKQT